MISPLALANPAELRALRRYLGSPKGSLLVILGLLVVVAAPAEDPGGVVRSIALGATAAALLDLGLGRLRGQAPFFPSGAILTGLIIAMVLSPTEPWFISVVAAALGIASKRLIRTRLANVFNPAALALVAVSLLFGSGQSWWGALPDRPPLTLGVLLALGIFMASRVHKLPMVLAFLGAYLTLFTVTAFIVDPAEVAEIFRSPDLNAALFFAFFMLDDPPTSPVRPFDQIQFGVVVAWVSYLVFVRIGAVYYLLAGVLVGNLWEAGRRWIERHDARRAR